MPQDVLNFRLFIISSLSKKCMTELMKSINTSFTNLIRRGLAREENVLHHAAD